MIYESYLHQYFDVKLHDSFWNGSNQTPWNFDTTGKSYNKGISPSKESVKRGVNTRLKNDSYKSGGEKTSVFLKSKEWKDSKRYKEILASYKSEKDKKIMSLSRIKSDEKIRKTKSIIGEDGLNISQRCQRQHNKKYNILNYKDKIIKIKIKL